jgi:hypothetical protein
MFRLARYLHCPLTAPHRTGGPEVAVRTVQPLTGFPEEAPFWERESRRGIVTYCHRVGHGGFTGLQAL